MGRIGWALNQKTDGSPVACRAGRITVHSRGVCGRALEPRDAREGRLGIAAAANRTRKSDRPG